MFMTRGEAVVQMIRDVLVEHWDPIGVMRDPDWPRDEYDAYIGDIYRYLARGESAEFIARHLCFIEDKKMGLSCPSESFRLPVALRLKAIDVSLDADP